MDDPLFTGNFENAILGKIRSAMMNTDRQRIILKALSEAFDDTLRFMSQHKLSLDANNIISRAVKLNEEICWAVDAIGRASTTHSVHDDLRAETVVTVHNIINAPTFSQAFDYASYLLTRYYTEAGLQNRLQPTFWNEVTHKLRCLTIDKIGILDRELPCKILQELRDIQDVFDTETEFLVQMKFRR